MTILRGKTTQDSQTRRRDEAQRRRRNNATDLASHLISDLITSNNNDSTARRQTDWFSLILHSFLRPRMILLLRIEIDWDTIRNEYWVKRSNNTSTYEYVVYKDGV